MPYSRGDVVLVPFPYTDNSTYKQRPALIVQYDSLITGFPQRVMAQITSEPRDGASRVQVKLATVEGKAMGLLMDSSLVIDCDDGISPSGPGLTPSSTGLVP